MKIEQLSNGRWRVFEMLEQPTQELIFDSFDDIEHWSADISKKIERVRQNAGLANTKRLIVQFFVTDTPANKAIVTQLNGCCTDEESIMHILTQTLNQIMGCKTNEPG